MNKRRIGAQAAAASAIAILLVVGSAVGRGEGPAEPGPIVGVKLYEVPEQIEDVFRQWASLGINTALVGEAVLADEGFRAAARKNGVALFVIFPVFQAPEELAQKPDLAAIKATGEPAREDWVQFVCPTRKEFRARRLEQLRRIVSAFRPDGVSLDFIRYFVFWEMVQPERTLDSLPQTCFCPSCLEDFGRSENVKLPEGLSGTAAAARWILERKPAEWTSWKCRTIAAAAEELAAAARAVDPAVKINVHLVPWRKDDFGGAIEAIAGQDLFRLGGLADYLSPMVYHHMVGQSPEWIHNVVQDVSERGRIAVLPSIQVDKAYVENELSAGEFKAALAESMKPPSRGVLFWNWIALSQSPEKQEIVRSFFRLRKSPD